MSLLDRSLVWPSWRHLGLAAIAAVAVGFGAQLQAKPSTPELGVVALTALPPEAQTTHRLILAGGPFPYSKDGVVFGNRERQLPLKARGYYREYTVRTLGAHDRGARRLVCGSLPRSVPEACFYTDDHYLSFKRVVR